MDNNVNNSLKTCNIQLIFLNWFDCLKTFRDDHGHRRVYEPRVVTKHDSDDEEIDRRVSFFLLDVTWIILKIFEFDDTRTRNAIQYKKMLRTYEKWPIKTTQPTFNCSKSIMESPEQCTKSIQSYQ